MLFDLIFLLFLINLVFKKSWFVWVFQTASPQGQHVFQPWNRAGTKTLIAKIFQEGTRKSQWAIWEDAVPGMVQPCLLGLLAEGFISQHSCAMEGERLFNYIWGFYTRWKDLHHGKLLSNVSCRGQSPAAPSDHLLAVGPACFLPPRLQNLPWLAKWQLALSPL